MGNQMFQYAMGRALSLRHNVPLKLDTTFLLDRTTFPHFLRPHFTFRDYNLGYFMIEADVAKPEEIGWWNRPFFSGWLMLGLDALFRKLSFLPGWEKSFTFDQRALSYGPDTYLTGFWQSEKYFKDTQPVLQKEFKLKNPSEKVQQLIQEVQSKNAVCLHVRRGDYVIGFHEALNTEYYTKALAIIAEKNPIECIYVFDRDDIEWCKENLKFEYPVVYVENDIPVAEAMIMMSHCKHFINANSSLSWWSAWLAENPDKIVITPKKWFEDQSMDDRDLIPESWIRI